VAVSGWMRKILLMLIAVLLAAPAFGVKAPKHHPHPVGHHAKNPQYPKKRGKNPQFQQSQVRKQRHKLAANHPKNPNLPKPKKAKRGKKHPS
jgi:hypothetical protein